MEISVITTIYKKGHDATKQVKRLHDFLEQKYSSFEIIAIADGYEENKISIEDIQKLRKTKKYQNILLLVNKQNKGKGYSVRKGLLASSGGIIVTIDGDLEIKLESLEKAIERINKGDVSVIAPSKYHTDSKIEVPFIRKIMSYIFQVFTNLLVATPKGVSDISCGLKVFTKESIDKITPHLQVHRFAIDTEMFYWINYYKMKVAITPFYAEVSKVSTAANPKQIFLMIKDVLLLSIITRMKTFNIKGHPYAKNFISIISVIGNI